jgi:hypothetical protein
LPIELVLHTEPALAEAREAEPVQIGSTKPAPTLAAQVATAIAPPFAVAMPTVGC